MTLGHCSDCDLGCHWSFQVIPWASTNTRLVEGQGQSTGGCQNELHLPAGLSLTQASCALCSQESTAPAKGCLPAGFQHPSVKVEKSCNPCSEPNSLPAACCCWWGLVRGSICRSHGTADGGSSWRRRQQQQELAVFFP